MSKSMREILFPEPVPYQEGGELLVSHDAHDNLAGAILDIENGGGKCDAIVLNTLNHVLLQLWNARACNE